MDTQRKVSRLLGLEIDEVSLVDRPANQHGLVTITKRDEGPMSGLFDAEGNEVDPSTLQVGDVVYDADDNELEYVDAETAQELAAEGEELYVPEAFLDEDADAEDREPALVGKSAGSAITGGASSVFQTGRKLSTRALRDLEAGRKHGRTGVNPGSNIGENDALRRVGAHFGRNQNAYVATTAGGTTSYAAGRRNGRKSVRKSLGETVLTELSKSLTDSDRDQVISKAMAEAETRVSKAEEYAQQAIAKAAELEERQEFAGFVEIAKGYALPVEEEELATLLQTVSKVLDEDQLGLLDRILYAAGESVAYDTLGADGLAPSAVEEVVKAHAHDVVAKSDLTEAEATVALFEQNPDMYLEYLSEQRG